MSRHRFSYGVSDPSALLSVVKLSPYTIIIAMVWTLWDYQVSDY